VGCAMPRVGSCVSKVKQFRASSINQQGNDQYLKVLESTLGEMSFLGSKGLLQESLDPCHHHD
jgi:hypothetical protein